MDNAERVRIRAIVKAEFTKHRFDYFAESVPNSNRPIVVPGCSLCRVRLQTVPQFVDHLCEKVEAAFEREFAGSTVNPAYPFPVALHNISTAPPS
jgi:hypothetical protein